MSHEETENARKFLNDDYEVLKKAHKSAMIETSVSNMAIKSITKECRLKDMATMVDVCGKIIQEVSNRNTYNDNNTVHDPVRCVFGLGSFSYLYEENRAFNVISPGLRISFKMFKWNIQKQLHNLRKEARQIMGLREYLNQITDVKEMKKITGILKLAKNCMLADTYTDILSNEEYRANAWYFHRSPNKDGHVFPTQVWYGKQLSVPGGGPVLDCGSGQWKLNDVPGAKPVTYDIEGKKVIQFIKNNKQEILDAVKQIWLQNSNKNLPDNTNVIMTGIYREKLGPLKDGHLHILTNEEEETFETNAVQNAIDSANLRTVKPNEFIGSFSYGNGSTQGRINNKLVFNNNGLTNVTIDSLAERVILKINEPINISQIRDNLKEITKLNKQV
jgi:hypothetical protein